MANRSFLIGLQGSEPVTEIPEARGPWLVGVGRNMVPALWRALFRHADMRIVAFGPRTYSTLLVDRATATIRAKSFARGLRTCPQVTGIDDVLERFETKLLACPADRLQLHDFEIQDMLAETDATHWIAASLRYVTDVCDGVRTGDDVLRGDDALDHFEAARIDPQNWRADLDWSSCLMGAPEW